MEDFIDDLAAIEELFEVLGALFLVFDIWHRVLAIVKRVHQRIVRLLVEIH